MALEEYLVGKIYVSSKVAMGMLAADEDESAMATCFCMRVHDGCEHD